MADIVTNPDDPNNPNNPNNQGNQDPINVGGAGGASAGSGGSGGGSSGSGGSAPAAGSGNTGNGLGFTNIAQAAGQNTTPNYDFVGSALQNQNNNVGNLMNTAYQNFLTSAGTAPSFNQSTFNNAIYNSSQPDQATVKGWTTDSYKGPTSWDTSSFTPQYQQYQQDVSGLHDSSGLYNWLTANAGETPGQAQLDAASLLQSPQYQASWNGWNTALQNETNQYKNYGDTSNSYAANLGSAYNNLNQATSANLLGVENGQMNNFNNIVARNNQLGTDLYSQYQNDLNQTGDYNVGKGHFYNYTSAPTANLTNSLTAGDVIPYNNVESILGKSLLNPTGGWQNGTIAFDSSGYNAATAKAKADADAAAAAAAKPPVQAPVYMPSGGGSFVCSELLRQGKISREEMDRVHVKAKTYSDFLWRGYWAWGLPTSRIMKTSKLATAITHHAFKNINDETVLGKIYAPIMYAVCAVVGLFTKEENYQDLTNLIRGRI